DDRQGAQPGGVPAWADQAEPDLARPAGRGQAAPDRGAGKRARSGALRRRGQRLLFRDETRLCLCPDRGSSCQAGDRPTRVRATGHSIARWLFGTVDVVTGAGLHQVFQRATSAEYLRHLDELRQLFADEGLRLVLARAADHDSDAVRDVLAHVGPRLELVWLPTQSPHLTGI